MAVIHLEKTIWDKHHTPNNSTKQKLRRYKQQKAHRGISLHQTAGRAKGTRNTFWSPRPNRPNPHALGLICDPDNKSVTHRQEKLDEARYQVQHSSPRKRPRQKSLSASHEDLPLVLSSDEEDLCVVDFEIVPMPDKEDPQGVSKDGNSGPDEETTHEKDDTKESPLSPPDYEKGSQVYEYEPKSPAYPPPDYASNDDTKSVPKLVTPPEEEVSPGTHNLSQDSPHGPTPADANANTDIFQDKERHFIITKELEEELNHAPWRKDTSSEVLNKLEHITPTVKPTYEGFWKDSDAKIINHLDAGTQRLKDKRSAVKNVDTATNPTANEPNPDDICKLCDEPLSHHILKCTKDDLQDELRATQEKVPLEPLSGPPEVVHPMPPSGHQAPLLPPPGIPANFSIKLNTVTKMKTGSPTHEAQMLASMTTQPRVILKKLTPEEIQRHTASD